MNFLIELKALPACGHDYNLLNIDKWDYLLSTFQNNLASVTHSEFVP